MLYPTCTTITSVDCVTLHIMEFLVLKIGYLWIVVNYNCAFMLFLFHLFYYFENSEICTTNFGIRNCEVNVMWTSGNR